MDTTFYEAAIEKIETNIMSLLDKQAEAIENVDLEKNMLDDGQSRVETWYRDPNAVFAAIEKLEKQRNYYLQLLNGFTVTLIPRRNIEYNGVVIPFYYI